MGADQVAIVLDPSPHGSREARAHVSAGMRQPEINRRVWQSKHRIKEELGIEGAGVYGEVPIMRPGNRCPISIQLGAVWSRASISAWSGTPRPRCPARSSSTGYPLARGQHAAESRPHALTDIEIVAGGRVAKEAQAKASERADWIASQQADSRYEGMDRLVPKDQADRLREISLRRTGALDMEGDPLTGDWRESADRIKGRLVCR